MAIADPVFGGGATFEQRLFMTTHFAPAGDPLERSAFVAKLRQRADAEAFALARELVTAELAAGVLDFLVSPAATAWWGAEGLALAGDPSPGDDFVEQMLAQCADPEGVGPAALARAREVLTADPTASPSPPRLAIVLGAARLQPPQARAIRDFAATPNGAAWFEARTKAFARAQQRFTAARTEAEQLGFLDPRDGLTDTVLPRFLPKDEAAPARPPACTLTLDDAGCWRVDGAVLAPASDLARLRAALRELRQRGLADGWLSLTSVPGDGRSHEVIAEALKIVVPKETPWAPVGELMKICSDPAIAFWAIELDVDPAIVPASILSPAGR